MWIRIAAGLLSTVICWSLVQTPATSSLPSLPPALPRAIFPLLEPAAAAPEGAAPAAPLPLPAAAVPIAPASAIASPLVVLPVFRAPTGERLTYRARVWKGFNFLGTDVGTVVFRIGEGLSDGSVTDVYEARAQGGGFGYEVAARTTAEVRRRDGRPLHYEMLQNGSRTSGQRIIFEDEQARVLKLKHCIAGQACADPAHQVKREVSAGWFRSRTVHVHCDDSDCEEPAHAVWRTRADVPVGATTRDMLSVIYYARGLSFTPEQPSHVVEVIQGKHVWQVQVHLLGAEVVEVPAGRFACSLIAITPISSHDEKFEGLFGIKGSLRVWLDQVSGQPVQVTGTIPFGVDLQGQVVLIDRGTELPDPQADNK